MGRALGADKIYYYPSKSFFFFLGKEGALVCYQKWKEEVRSDQYINLAKRGGDL